MWSKEIQLIDKLFDKQREWYKNLNEELLNNNYHLIKVSLIFISYYNDLITEELNKLKGETNENK